MSKKKIIAAVAIAMAMGCTFAFGACDKGATNDDIANKVDTVTEKVDAVDGKVDDIADKIDDIAEAVIEKPVQRVTTAAIPQLALSDVYEAKTAEETAYKATKIAVESVQELEGFTPTEYGELNGVIVFTSRSENGAEYKYYSVKAGRVILTRSATDTFGVTAVSLGGENVNALITSGWDNSAGVYVYSLIDIYGTTLTTYKSNYQYADASITYPYGVVAYTTDIYMCRGVSNTMITLNDGNYMLNSVTGGVVRSDDKFGYVGTPISETVGDYNYNGQYFCTDQSYNGKPENVLTIYSVEDGLITAKAQEYRLPACDTYSYYLLSNGNVLIQTFTQATADDYDCYSTDSATGYVDYAHYLLTKSAGGDKWTESKISLDFLLVGNSTNSNVDAVNDCYFYSNVAGGVFGGVFKSNVKNVARICKIINGTVTTSTSLTAERTKFAVSFNDDGTIAGEFAASERYGGDSTYLMTPTYQGKYTDGRYLYSYDETTKEYTIIAEVARQTYNERYIIGADKIYDYNKAVAYDLAANGMTYAGLTETGAVLKSVADGTYHYFDKDGKLTPLGGSFAELSSSGMEGAIYDGLGYRYYDYKYYVAQDSDAGTYSICDFAGNNLFAGKTITAYQRLGSGTVLITYTTAESSDPVTECYIIEAN